jgi:hypothetical protein
VEISATFVPLLFDFLQTNLRHDRKFPELVVQCMEVRKIQIQPCRGASFSGLVACMVRQGSAVQCSVSGGRRSISHAT